MFHHQRRKDKLWKAFPKLALNYKTFGIANLGHYVTIREFKPVINVPTYYDENAVSSQQKRFNQIIQRNNL